MVRSRWTCLLAALAVACLVAGCGGDDATTQAGQGGGGSETVVVSAAASLTESLTACRDAVPGVRPRMSFAGSDELAAQIRQGVKPDVYLAANTKLPDQLAQEGRLGTPVRFATNTLVLAVPAGSRITSLDDVAKQGVTLVIGSASVPIGSYTREVLARLGAAEAKAVLANVRSDEPDVKGIIGKLTQGAADAGFVYNTDVTAARGRLKAIDLAAGLQPSVAYGGGVVQGAPHPDAARAYLESVTSGACAKALRDAGFGPPA
jgi:molybdate transport system substrate-binding protein